MSRQSGWIAPIVVSGGVISGTWAIDSEVVRVAWFKEAGKAPRAALAAEVDRLSSVVGGDRRLELGLA